MVRQQDSAVAVLCAHVEQVELPVNMIVQCGGRFLKGRPYVYILHYLSQPLPTEKPVLKAELHLSGPDRPKMR